MSCTWRHDITLPVSGLRLRNRVVKAATFEGLWGQEGDDDSDNSLSPLAAFHARTASSGVGVSTVSYGCVAPAGRTFAAQPLIDGEDEDICKALRAVAEAIQGAPSRLSSEASDAGGGPKCSDADVPCRAILQLTHAGYFADPTGGGALPRDALDPEVRVTVAPSRVINPATMRFPRAATPQDLDNIVRQFADAARTAVEKCAFDGVEIHCGHGYLLSQFLSPFSNRRTDEYGGSIENRARLALRVVRAVRKAVGPGEHFLSLRASKILAVC
jgi:2,4-dienoyl-CoA reductase-like NADH-dependent reductase (Old Yellow Enzyme family)